MLRVHRRIEKLEQARGLSDRTEPFEFHINFVDRDGRCRRTLVMSDGRREWIDHEVSEESRSEEPGRAAMG